jgi:hypothetical protein
MGIGMISTWIMSKVSLKGFLILIALCSCSYLGYEGYNWIYNRGAAHQLTAIDQPKIDTAVKAQAKAEADKAAYVQTYNDWITTTNASNAALIAQQKATIDKLQTQANQLPALVQANEKLKHEITSYISAQVDAACVLPVGFVRLYNSSVQADSPAGTGTDVPASLAGNDASPSGIACSVMASVLLDNTNEAVIRGKLLGMWQTWYAENSANFNAAAKAKAAAIPKE